MFHFMQLFSADVTIFKKKIALQNIKKCAQKLLIIPLDKDFLLCGTETVF